MILQTRRYTTHYICVTRVTQPFFKSPTNCFVPISVGATDFFFAEGPFGLLADGPFDSRLTCVSDKEVRVIATSSTSYFIGIPQLGCYGHTLNALKTLTHFWMGGSHLSAIILIQTTDDRCPAGSLKLTGTTPPRACC